jgi:c-di-GMP-binding flagellar brake protein YcgR
MTILRSVWQKLSGKQHTAETATLEIPTPTTLALASVSPIAKVAQDTIPSQYLPLWHLLNQRQMIEVKVEGCSSTYQTLVLAIDAERGLLWLDDLFPNQHALEVGDQITLRHLRSGEQLSFSSPIIAWGSTYGANGLAIMLPEQLSYTPRRQFVRADMSDKPSLSLKLRALGQDFCFGNVLDISSGGLRASIAGNILEQLRHGALLPVCEFSLSDELTIRCSARVRSFRLVRTPHRHTQVSIEFVDLPAERAQQLQQFINNLIFLQQSPEIPKLRSA